MSISAGPEIGLRERQKSARRKALVQAAQELVLAHGLDAVTVEAISARAGVSARTFFNYFESKDEAVLGMPAFTMDPQVAAEFAAGGPDGRPIEDITALAGSLLSTDAPTGDTMRRTLEIAGAEPRLVVQQFAWFERHEAELRALFAARRAVRPTPVDDDLGCQVVLVLVRATAVVWEHSGYAGDPVSHLPVAVSQLRHLLDDEVSLP